MQKLSKLILLLFLVVSLHTTYYILHTTAVLAQVPGLRFPCDDVDSPEFHSLRPYQAAFCGDANKALYCSNDLKFLETFDVTGKGDCVARHEEGTHNFLCNPDFTVKPHTLIVTLDDSMFPIMGNTEEVKNSQNSGDTYDDATKVNEYASWYLSGVNNRAEYGENTDDRTVNYSGPLQKLLPKMIQEAERIRTIDKATIETHWIDSTTGETFDTPQNHDQVVVCGKEEGFGWLGNLVGVGVTKPVPCYEDEEYRLSKWLDDLSIFNGLFNRIGTDIWNKRTPPLPWDDGTGKPFETQTKYQKAYNEWRGQACATIPFIDINLCIENPFVPNKWAELYQHIPLSNTTDKKGANLIMDVQPAPAGGTQIVDGSFDYGEVRPAPLYFAHTQEVKESAELLNKTFTPLDCPVDENGKRIESEDCKLLENKRGSVEPNNCSVANIRVNKGDNLFPGDPDELQVPDVTYIINQAKCHEVYEMKTYCNRPGKCGAGNTDCCNIWTTSLECTAQVYITIKTKTKTPNADEIFNETVAGTGSTFRKIFPKVEEGAPVSCIADMPTVTNVTYDASGSVPPPGGDLEFVGVVRFPEDGAGDSPQLTFPHIGSVYEYFLKGIQTALRPKGYGEPITSGTLCSTLDGGDCSFDLDKIHSAIQKAAAKYKIPAKLLNSIFEIESYEYIADPSSYVCEENFAGAAGVAQIVKDTYEYVTCGDEKMENDIPMCGDYDPKLSRCSIDDAFELMARILLLKAGRWNSSSCVPYSGIAESEKMVWYNAACNYYGTHDADNLTIGLSEDIPASERRIGGDMNYCDIVCYKMGQCPDYP
ncbi:MAG: hypothetical protein ACD_19C00014G0021 [uncultured bacterium]|nr:MAG: hypothetical protein ACD_19C00014G0021 [uncultured bacterium]